MKLVNLAAAVVLVGATTVACGGSPSDASAEDFCGGLDDVAAAYAAVDFEEPTEDQVAGIKDAVADFADTGTPEDISDDARAGFELITEGIADLADDASAEDLQKASADFNGEEEKQADAFDAYVEKTCLDEGADSGE